MKKYKTQVPIIGKSKISMRRDLENLDTRLYESALSADEYSTEDRSPKADFGKK